MTFFYKNSPSRRLATPSVLPAPYIYILYIYIHTHTQIYCTHVFGRPGTTRMVSGMAREGRPTTWPLQYVALLLVVCAWINRPFILPARLHCPHCFNTIARLLGIIRPPPDPSFVWHTPYNIGNNNVVSRPPHHVGTKLITLKVPCAPKWNDFEFPIIKTTKLWVETRSGTWAKRI